MFLNRSLPRNVTFHNATRPDETLRGFDKHASITEANFLDILGMLLVIKDPIRVQERV